jgi:hypothetical protein
LHGTGGGNVPDLVNSGALFCSSQEFDGLSWISVPQDGISPGQPFTVSAMIRLSEPFKARTWFSRGQDEPGNRWVFSLTNSFANHITARIQTDQGVFEAFSSTRLKLNQWQHVAAVFVPSVGLRVYVDGVGGNLLEVQGTPIEMTNGGFLGRFNSGSFAIGRLTEVRLAAMARSQAWLAAERAVMCGSLVDVGDEEAV